MLLFGKIRVKMFLTRKYADNYAEQRGKNYFCNFKLFYQKFIQIKRGRKALSFFWGRFTPSLFYIQKIFFKIIITILK